MIAKNQYHKNELSYWKHHKKVFNLISSKFFHNNIYETFNEYVFHMVMCFLQAWKNSRQNLEGHLLWNLDQMELR